jgi:asparagine synthase (glutamine-hydrolysing)
MNLFIVKWGESPAAASDLGAALTKDAMHAKMASGRQTIEWESDCSTLAFACVHEGPERVAPRDYVYQDAKELVAYDGLPVDSKHRFSAHVAREIADNWKELDSDIDGFYAAVRIVKNPLRLEVQTDFFGVYKLYRWTDGRSWILSNSVDAIDALVPGIALDMSAAGMLLALSWLPGKFTLLDGVHCLGPNSRITWSNDSQGPVEKRLTQLGDLFEYPPTAVTDETVSELSATLVGVFESMGSSFDNVLCPLTGGKDSRLLAVLLKEAGVTGRSYTYGNALGTDAKIAVQVAEILGIEHENLLTSTDDLFSDWDDVSAEFVRLGAGLCPLQLITGSVTARQVDAANKPVRLWGAGSSICRAPYFFAPEYMRKPKFETVAGRFRRTLVKDFRGLVRSDAIADARRYIVDELGQYHGNGVRLRDLPDIFWIHERGAARSGKNMRVSMNYRDTFSPFFSHSFAVASFGMSALQRATEPLHFRLLKQFSPESHAVPFDKGGWKNQNRYLNLLEELHKFARFRASVLAAKRIPGAKQVRSQHMLVKDTMFERLQWLRNLVGGMREEISDPQNAEMWELIDREKFMRITSDGVSDRELAFYVVPLFEILTLLTYKRVRNSRP